MEGHRRQAYAVRMGDRLFRWFGWICLPLGYFGAASMDVGHGPEGIEPVESVSYTHLTLPTTPYV